MPSAKGSNGNGQSGHESNELPASWDQSQIDEILAKMSEGESLRDACLDVGIARKTFAWWVIKDINGLAAHYAHARTLQIATMEDQIRAIADDSRKDTTTRRDGSGNEYEVPDHEWIARSKLRVDTLKWIMSKIAPKQYGERSEAAVTIDERKTVTIEIDPNKNHRRLMESDGRHLVEIEPSSGANGNGTNGHH